VLDFREAALATVLLAGLLTSCSPSHDNDSVAGSWSPQAAGTYLDQRANWWMEWGGAARDHETFCISCHTTLPYALSRAALHESLPPSANEQRLLDNVTKRVRLWNEVGPYYDEKSGEHKPIESRGTEAVLNALVLASHDARNGRLSAEARTAFANMWAAQQPSGELRGSWAWLQFNLRPWEAADSRYYGASLAALAVGIAPENYRSTAEIQKNLDLLRDYLSREFPRQSLANRLYLLWASTKWADLLDPERKRALVNEAIDEQRSDGGWGLATLARTWKGSTLRGYVRSWIRQDWTLVDMKSDAYATAFVTFVLMQAGIPRSDVHVQRGLSWLVQTQDKSMGQWRSQSLNRRRDGSTNAGRLMSDAATAYSVLALTEANRH